MAGFTKPKPMQAAMKVAIFGPPGSGKTFTTLLIVEGIAKRDGKRVAYVDTEHGTDFYVQDIADRKIHPAAFDVDCLYSRSLADIDAAVRSLDPEVYCCVVIDSFTHLWEAAKNSYTGRTNSNGQLPFHAWGKIKKPYKALENFLMNSPFHVFLLGRQGVDYQDDETGELKAAGFKMKAEGETPYEPNALIRLEAVKGRKDNRQTIVAIAEKDRTGILAGKVIEWPCFENIAAPILNILGTEQAQIESTESARTRDVEHFAEEEGAKFEDSAELRKNYAARYQLANNWESVAGISEELTPEVKKRFLSNDLADVRELCRIAMEKHPKPKQLSKAELLEAIDKAFDMMGVGKESELAAAGELISIPEKVKKIESLKKDDLERLNRALSEEMSGTVDGG